MLCGRKAEPFNDSNYLYDLDYSGIRCLAYLDPVAQRTTLVSPTGIKLCPRFPELLNLHERVESKCVLDGEIIVVNNDLADYEVVKARALFKKKYDVEAEAKRRPATFIAHDLLYFHNDDITYHSLTDRRKLLAHSMAPHAGFSLSYAVEKDGREFFNLARHKKLEGIIAKRKSSIYYSQTRSQDWISIRNSLVDDFIVCGYKRNQRNSVSLMLGQYNERNGLVYQGKVNLRTNSSDFKIVRSQRVRNRPIFCSVISSNTRNATWLETGLVCRVSFMTRSNGEMKYPLFKELRIDKQPEEARILPTFDEVSPHAGLVLT